MSAIVIQKWKEVRQGPEYIWKSFYGQMRPVSGELSLIYLSFHQGQMWSCYQLQWGKENGEVYWYHTVNQFLTGSVTCLGRGRAIHRSRCLLRVTADSTTRVGGTGYVCFRGTTYLKSANLLCVLAWMWQGDLIRSDNNLSSPAGEFVWQSHMYPFNNE